MGYQRMTQAEWADLIAKQGYENAAQIAQNFGTVLEETGRPPTAVNPALAARPMVTRASASAIVPPATRGNQPMPAPTGGLSAAMQPKQPPQEDEGLLLARELAALPNERAVLRKQQFKESQRRIGEMYGGPSQGNTLLALSQAFLAPRRYKGFAGTMYNVTQALNQIGQQRQGAEQKRAEALARLQESYQTGQFDDHETALNARLKLLELQREADAAAAKAREPKYSPLQTGGFQQQPGTGGLPGMPQPDENGNYVITDARQISFLPKGTPMVRAGDPAYKVGYAPGPAR